MGQSRGDVLSAASLLLAILAVLYSLWYAEIASALKIEVPRHLEDAASDRRRVGDVMRTRALPLGLSAFVVAVVFLPEAVRISIDWIQDVSDEGLRSAVEHYDPVSLSLVLVVIAMAALAVYTCTLAARLWSLRHRLTPQRGAG